MCASWHIYSCRISNLGFCLHQPADDPHYHLVPSCYPAGPVIPHCCHHYCFGCRNHHCRHLIVSIHTAVTLQSSTKTVNMFALSLDCSTCLRIFQSVEKKSSKMHESSIANNACVPLLMMPFLFVT